jgi:hypothetical protein
VTWTWTLSDLEFVVLWEETGHDTLPLPLTFATDLRDRNLFDQAKFDTRERLAAVRNSGVDLLLSVLAHPDIHLSVHAHHGTDSELASESIRIYAARQGEHCYIVRQVPGKTIWHSGGFVVNACPALELAAVVVRELPEEPAGRYSNIPLHQTDSASSGEVDPYTMADLVVENDDYTDQLADYLLTSPAQRIGRIAISQGSSRFGPRGITRRRLGWRDLIDDGRYTLTQGTPAAAYGTDGNRMVNMINTEIAEIVRAIKDERES